MAFIRFSSLKNRRVESANYLVRRQPVRHPSRCLPYHDLLFIREGAWEVWEEDQRFPLEAGDLLFLFAGRKHRGVKECMRGTRVMYLHLWPDADDRWIPKRALAPSDPPFYHVAQHTRAAARSTAQEWFEKVVQAYWSRSPALRAGSAALATQLLLSLSAAGDPEGMPSDPIQRVLHAIEHQPAVFHSLDELVELSGLKRRSFSTLFRQRTFRSPHQFQLDHKIALARSRLEAAPTTPVNVLAEALGFSDPFHFSKTFRKITGLAPSEYRKSRVQPRS
jgi:AraC-like DNA-binding protein